MHKSRLIISLGAALLLLGMAAVACTSKGPSDEELAAAQSTASAAKTEAEVAKAQAEAAARELAKQEAIMETSQEAISVLSAELAELRKSSGDQNAVLTTIQASLTQKEKDALAATTKASELEAKLKAVAPVTIAQMGTIQGSAAQAQPSGWDTAESIRGGLKLAATFDSSGPDAWDNKAHPDVYVSSLGGPGTGGKEVFPGVHVIDSYSKEVIASATYNLGATVSPHTVGISPDGKWFYLQGVRAIDEKTVENNVYIINARTLKLDKIVKQESMYMGGLRSQRLHHVTTFKTSKGKDLVALQFGFGSSGGPHFLIDPSDNQRVVKAITMDDTGYPMGHPFLTVDPTGKFLFVSLKMSAWADVAHGVAGIAKINMENWAVTVIPAVGDHLIGLMTTADGKFLYAVDGHESQVYKIDLALNQVVGKTSANVAGPYGLSLSWDEKLLFVNGKGESAANVGHVMGVVDTTTFRPASVAVLKGVNQPIELGEGSSSTDHSQLHPDPKVNELWISNMRGTVTTVLDLNTYKVKARIPTPDGANTHSGGFIRYGADWTGKVLADHGGPKEDMLKVRLEMAKAAAATATPAPATATPAPR